MARGGDRRAAVARSSERFARWPSARWCFRSHPAWPGAAVSPVAGSPDICGIVASAPSWCALLIAKAGSSFLVRDGWCVQFDTPQPLVADSTGRIHSWDVRADWRSATPQCSAIMTRPYDEYKRFPTWFFNLPPTDGNLPGPEDRPPYATLDMTVRGYVHADAAGELGLETGAAMITEMVVDGLVVGPTMRRIIAPASAPALTSSRSSLASPATTGASRRTGTARRLDRPASSPRRWRRPTVSTDRFADRFAC